MNNDEAVEILKENRQMRKALEFIKAWDLPEVTLNGEKCSYEAARGSNGARDYMRAIATDALTP